MQNITAIAARSLCNRSACYEETVRAQEASTSGTASDRLSKQKKPEEQKIQQTGSKKHKELEFTRKWTVHVFPICSMYTCYTCIYMYICTIADADLHRAYFIASITIIPKFADPILYKF